MRKITSKFSGIKVLIVEDNEINQEVTKDILELLGCQADIAVNGLEGVQMALKTYYELILMDIQLPEMDGYQAAQQIRKNETGPRTIIVALTASALDGDLKKCLNAGMDSYITKPMEAACLEDALLKFFPHKKI